tara:strand:+ start:312 stop:656 length:345 start_codon:yes stop_codon:yes gene_type:complete
MVKKKVVTKTKPIENAPHENIQDNELKIAELILKRVNYVIYSIIACGFTLSLVAMIHLKDTAISLAIFSIFSFILGIQTKLANVIEKRIFENGSAKPKKEEIPPSEIIDEYGKG